MEKFLYKKKVRIFFYVLSGHVLVILFLSVHQFIYFSKISIPVPIAVREFVVQEEKPKPAEKKIYVKKSRPKVVVAQKQPRPKRSTHHDHLLSKIEKQLDATAVKKNYKETLSVPKKIERLSIDTKIEVSHHEGNKQYQSRLIEEMQNHLHLPEYGEVCMELMIDRRGQITNIKVLETKSKKNEMYLKHALEEMTFPWIREFFSEKNSMQFTITFRNQN